MRSSDVRAGRTDSTASEAAPVTSGHAVHGDEVETATAVVTVISVNACMRAARRAVGRDQLDKRGQDRSGLAAARHFLTLRIWHGVLEEWVAIHLKPLWLGISTSVHYCRGIAADRGVVDDDPPRRCSGSAHGQRRASPGWNDRRCSRWLLSCSSLSG